ncbi:MAG: DUF1343 domain-containing protein [Deltaproteobacteria bacterium]|nr:DUF1343 domain-containing protein [Deltaproteobacteria bacterium]MBW2072045.1 DUF1343 domain-containing protein [Deltaproteobacteria bacterium]
MASIALGIDALLLTKPQWLTTARLGLLANQASVDSQLIHTSQRLLAAGAHLTALFSPQHGYHGEQQANMVESANFVDEELKIPVFSLYSDTRKPTAEMLDLIDILLIDLQDVGTRVYTFGTTLALCLEAARQHGVRVVVLDRPNPVGGLHVEGNILDMERRSFVGYFPVPMRHGLTLAEMARFYNMEFGLVAQLETFVMAGWSRAMFFRQTGLNWVPPSPNLPTPESALVYPGQVILEGTNLSEGRGTTTPFELWGGPYVQPRKILEKLADPELEGALLRPAVFQPCFDKWSGQQCYGFQIHVTSADKYKPFATSLSLLQATILSHPDEFAWLPPPYEYEFHHLPIEIILGSSTLHKDLEAGVPIRDLLDSWAPHLKDYQECCQPYLLYRD